MRTLTGINFNSNPSQIKDGSSKLVKNFIETVDQKAIVNENGFDKFYETNGIFVGNISLPDGLILFVKKSHLLVDNRDEIVLVKEDGTTKVIKSYYFKFDINYPISGQYTYNQNGELIVTFSEGVNSKNERRIINIDKSGTILSDKDVLLLNIIPDLYYPTLSFNVGSGGSIFAGVYQIAISYKIDDSSYSNYSLLHKSIYVVGDKSEHIQPGELVNKFIDIFFSNIDTKYKKFKLGILFKGLDEAEKCYETKDLETSITHYKLMSMDALSSISIEDLTIPSISYIKDEESTVFINRLYRGNVRTVDYTNIDSVLQTVADNTKVEVVLRSAVDVFNSVYDENIKTHFKEGEHYALYLGAIDYKGNFINAYPIKNKEGDTTEGVYIDEDHSFLIHRIPMITARVPGAIKTVSDLACTLPANIGTLLGDFKNTVSSFCFFFAKHTLYNSKILGQAYVIRDTHINDFEDNQTYHYPFSSNTKIRAYSFEHLFNKSSLSNIHISNYQNLVRFSNTEFKENGLVRDNISYGNYIKIYNEDQRVKNQSVISITDTKFIENDNAVMNNIAGDSFHRITAPATEFDKLFGSTPNSYPTSSYSRVNKFYLSDPNNNGSLDKAAIVDLVSNNDYFFSDLYDQKLVICSSIYKKEYNQQIILSGDFFYDNFTFRMTTPTHHYRFGTEDVDLQGEDYVYKVIVSINLESRANFRARFNGVNTYQKVTNIYSSSNPDVDILLDIPYANDNFINTKEGKGYTVNSNFIGYDYIDYTKELDYKFNHSNRVIRSIVYSKESKATPWRKYLANDYIDLPMNGDRITALKSDQQTVYIQQLNALYVAFVRDKIANSSEGDSYLGSADVFDREPIQVIYDQNGYIGSQSRFNSCITPFGYFVIDSIKKNIFLVKINSPKRISDETSEVFFRTNLVANLFNPYKSTGICLGYDDLLKSIFITQNGSKPFTLHYNLNRNQFTSFHDYIPNGYCNTRDKSYCFNSKTVYRKYADNRCLFFSDIPYKSIIELYFNPEPDTFKLIKGIGFDTRVSIDGKLNYDKTFDRLMIYNDTQCTGYISLNDAKDWFETEHGVYKKDMWFFNNIKDLVFDDKEPFLKDGELIETNIIKEKAWFDISDFISKYVVVRFEKDNTIIDDKQEEIIFNLLDINAERSIR